MGGRVCARSVGEAAGRCGRGMEIQASIPERNPRTQSKAVGAAVCTTWVTRRALHTHTHTHILSPGSWICPLWLPKQ